MFENETIDIIGEPWIRRAADQARQYNEHLIKLTTRIQLESGADIVPEELTYTLQVVGALQKHLESSANGNHAQLQGELAKNYIAALKWLLSEVDERIIELRKRGAKNELLKGLEEGKKRLEDNLRFPAYQVFSNVQPISASRYFGAPPPPLTTEIKAHQPPRKVKTAQPIPAQKQLPTSLTSYLTHPASSLILTLFLGACAFIGKSSIVAAWMFLALAWVVSCIFFWEIPELESRRLLRGVLALLSALVFIAFALWLKPDTVAATSGIIGPRRVLFSSSNPMKNVRIEIGQSGDIAEISGPKPTFTFLFSRSSSLRLEVLNGQLLVSTQIRDTKGDLIAEIVQNEWKVFPTAWDRNYNDDTFEVRNAKGKIALQVRALPDRIQLQGEWPTDDGKIIRLVDSRNPNAPLGSRGLIARYNGKDDSKTPQIMPLFQYPSERHLGHLEPIPRAMPLGKQ